MRNNKVRVLAECAIMLALAFTLSCARLGKMPLGGSITVASMLPIMLVSFKYGPIIGTGTAFLYSVTQAIQALIEGDVFPYCETGATLFICVMFDYIVPFTILGLSGIFKNVKFLKKQEIGLYVGMFMTVFLRFMSHFITGVVIWKQWAPEGMGKYLYSFLYNGSFLSVDFAICLITAVLILRSSEIKKLVRLNTKKQSQNNESTFEIDKVANYK